MYLREFDATVAAIEARRQAAREKRFAGMKERNYTCHVVTAKPLCDGGTCEMERRKIRGYTFAGTPKSKRESDRRKGKR